MQTGFSSNPSDLVNIVSVESVDVAHNLALVGTDGGQEEKVLQALVIAEWRRLDDNLFQEFNQLVGQIVLHESLDSNRNVVGTSAFGDSDSYDLVDQRSPMYTVGFEDLVPEVKLSSLDKVTRLMLVHLVLVGDVNEFVIAETLGIGNVCQVRVALFAVFSDYKRLVDL